MLGGSMGYDYKQTHDRIMGSATEHFAKKGFLGASIRQICTDAGVTNGAFYSHFESKEDLFSKIVEPVVEGMQELYDGENSYYMDIQSADDVKRLMEQTFSSNKLMIRYVYKNADIFKMLLTAGVGTKYEKFVENLVTEETSNTMEFLDKCSFYIENTEKISESLVKLMSHFIVSSVFDGLLEGREEETVIKEAKLVSEFCMAGMKHLLGICNE